MIDLHLHTVHSDGTDSVKELLENAERNKIEIISITDHNSVDAYYEIEQNPEIRNIFSGKIIVGCELKTTYNKVNIEIDGFDKARFFSVDELVELNYDFDKCCPFPHIEEEVLEPAELIARYQAERRELNENIDRILADISAMLEVQE